LKGEKMTSPQRHRDRSAAALRLAATKEWLTQSRQAHQEERYGNSLLPTFVALWLRARTKYLSYKGLHRVKICAGRQDFKK
jgi:hypothetical protein